MVFQLALMQGEAMLKKNGYSIEEEADIYDTQLEDLYNDPRWYLDNLPYMQEYRLRWVDYKFSPSSTPYKYVKKKGL